MVARAGRQDRPQDDPRAAGESVLKPARLAVLAAGTAALVAYAWVSVEMHGARTDPERFLARGGLVAPPARAWNEAADAHSSDGLRVLNDTARPAAERLRGYRTELEKADRLFVESLRAQPAQARTLAQLAAIRWELHAPMDAKESDRHLAMMEAASEMAPRVPRVQLQIGTQLLEMGKRPDAEIHLRRTAELDPTLTDEVVRVLRDASYEPEELLRVLPPGAATLVALEDAFLSEDEAAAYLEAIEPALAHPEPRLLAVFADACLAAGQAARLSAKLGALGESKDPALEAERRIQSARARLALGELPAAVEDARAAAALRPEDPRMAALHGQISLAAGNAADAIEAFRRALGIVAKGSSTPGSRAKLYREIGRCEERLGNPSRAYDAYLRALGLDPEESFARERVAQMRKAAGMAPAAP